METHEFGSFAEDPNVHSTAENFQMSVTYHPEPVFGTGKIVQRVRTLATKPDIPSVIIPRTHMVEVESHFSQDVL